MCVCVCVCVCGGWVCMQRYSAVLLGNVSQTEEMRALGKTRGGGAVFVWGKL